MQLTLEILGGGGFPMDIGAKHEQIFVGFDTVHMF